MKRLLLLLTLILGISQVSNAQLPQYYCAGGTSLNTFPFSTNNKQIQWLFLNTDYGSTPPTGFITKIYFRSGLTPSGPSTYTDFEVQLGNTALTAIPSTTYATGLTTCISANPFTTTATAVAGTSGGNNGWIGFDLATPFYYDATQNLMVKITQSTTANGFYIWHYIASGNRRIYGDRGNTTGLGADVYRADFGFDIFAGFPCVGTPTSTVTAPIEVCPNRQFGISPTTYYANATYQWEYSTNGSTWQPHPAPVGLYGNIADAITVPTWYRCTITCIGGASYLTPAWKVNISPFYYCYCVNNAQVAGGLDIGNVKVQFVPTAPNLRPIVSSDTLLNNGIATPTLTNSTASKTYSTFQYTNPPVVMYRDTTYRFLVSQINSAATFKNGNVVILVDFNRNGIFDGNEKVMEKTITGASVFPSTEVDTFKVPITANIGLTGMRVILGSGVTDSCGTFTGEGEVEDYIVDLRNEPCKGGGNPGVIVATDKKLCDNYDYILYDTTYEKTKSELVRVWEISADNVYWYGIAGSTDKDTLMRVFTGQPLNYRVRMICGRTNDTTYSPVFKVDAKDGYKCYCFSQAIGVNKDTSDIGGLGISTFLANSGGAHLLNANAYRKRSDYTEEAPTVMYADSTYQITVFHTMRTPEHGDAKVTVFMDFNNDKEYDIPEERVYTGYTSVGNFTLVDNIKIPTKVITDVPTGMRVILNNDIAPNNPSDLACGTYISGETEDLMVMFRRNFPAGITSANISDFGLYPNPTTGKFRLQFTSTEQFKDLTLTITNVTGQQVMQESYKHNGGQFVKDLDMSGKPSGVYFIELTADGQKTVKKLIVE